MTNSEEIIKILGKDLIKEIAQGAAGEPANPTTPTFRSNRWGASRGVGDFGRINYTIPRVGLPPETPRANLYGKSLNPNRAPVGGGVPMENVFRWEESPANQRLFSERRAAWEERAAEVGAKQIEAREQAIAAYRNASPQERMMIAPELRTQIESEILARNTTALAKTAPIPAPARMRVPTPPSQAADTMAANRQSLALWAAKPSAPPPVERPAALRGGGFYVPPEYVRLQREQEQKIRNWTTASDLVASQRRKLLNRAITNPLEEE